jgi:uncharacterized protein (TIGR00266 family)
MQAKIEGSPSFAYLHVDLGPGESVVAESDAMASMDAALDLKAVFNGGFVSAVLRKIFGGESLFVNVFTNNTDRPRRVTLVQATPGDIKQIPMQGNALCLQAGAYLASTPGVRLSVRWAGFASFLAREGLFKLLVHGNGVLWFGAYGGVLFKDVKGATIVDSAHLVAYEPQIRLKLQLAGGLFSSFFGGEGLVTRVEGQGKIALQTRSLEGLRDYLNPKLF